MSKAPYMKFYINAWISDTHTLTDPQYATYHRLLCSMWKAGGRLADDDNLLRTHAKQSPAKWRKIRTVLIDGPEAVLYSKGGYVYNDRLKKEYENMQKISEIKSENAKSKSKKRIQNKNSYDSSSLKNNETPKASAERNQPYARGISDFSSSDDITPPIGGVAPACACEGSANSQVLDIADRLSQQQPQAVRFPDFYEAHPRSSKRDAARYHWMQYELDPVADLILADIANRIANDPQWSEQGGRFIPGPLTYLEGKYWTKPITKASTAESSRDRDARATIEAFVNRS